MNIHAEFLEQSNASTNDSAKGKELVPKAPRLKIDEGSYDKGNLLRDAQTSMGGLELFKKWFS